MAVSINRIHSENKIIASSDDLYYRYTQSGWLKENIEKYEKYFDVNVDEINLSDKNIEDKILMYSKKTNDFLYSDTYDGKPIDKSIDIIKTDELNYIESKTYNIWDGNNLIITPYSYVFPNGSKSYNFNTQNYESNICAHFVQQSFYTSTKNYYVFSTFIKPESGGVNTYLSLGVHNFSCGFGPYAKINLNDYHDYDEDGYAEINDIVYLNNNFDVINLDNIVIKKYYPNVSAGIQLIDDGNDNVYYRLFLKISTECAGKCFYRINVLNANGDFKYNSIINNEYYTVYAGGSQLEKRKLILDDELLNKIRPWDYISTIEKPKSYRTLDKIYTVKRNSETSTKELRDLGNKIYYLKNAPRTINDIKKEIKNPNIGDIAVVPTMISFTQKNNGETDSYDTAVVLGKKPGDEDGAIYFDSENMCYKIKNGEKWQVLANTHSNKEFNKILLSMLFNQNRFETWCKQQYGFVNRYGINTGGASNFWSPKGNPKF